MINLKTPGEIAVMREGGQKLGKILQNLLEFAQIGVSLNEIESLANKLIQATGGSASFKTVAGYSWATCLCVNDVVVHGIPSDYVLRTEDNLTIDIGLLYEGFHTDTAWAKLIRDKRPAPPAGRQVTIDMKEKEKFLKTGEEALWKAIDLAKAGNHIGHISQAIQSTVEGAGYSIVKSLVGHGVGRELHEEPHVPGFVRGEIENTPMLTPGMVIAIEVIYARGRGEAVYANDDGWTIATRDGTIAAVFEHTLAITKDGPLVLTKAVN